MQLPNEVPHPTNSDHVTINKFGKDERVRYQLVGFAVRELIEDAVRELIEEARAEVKQLQKGRSVTEL
jgi:hypothetical protein